MFEETELHLRDYLQVIMKWRWLILAVAIPIAVGVAYKSLTTTPFYKATARILIERAAPNVVSFADPGALSTSSYWWDPQFLETQLNILKSQAVVKRVIQKLGPTIQSYLQVILAQPSQISPPEGQTQKKTAGRQILDSIRAWLKHLSEFVGKKTPLPLSETAKAAIQEDRQVNSFLGMITVEPVKDSRLVNVSITAMNPEHAALIANMLVDTYIEYTLESRAAASRDAVRWLMDEVEQARQKMTDAEAALQQYKEQHEILSIEGRQNIVMQKFADLSAAVNEIKIKRITLEAQYKEIQQYGSFQLESLPAVIQNPTIQALKVDLSKMESELSELQETFRSKHPRVAALQSQIEALQQKIKAEVNRIPESIRREYEIALAQERELAKTLEEYKRETFELNQKSIMYGILEKEVGSSQIIYNALLQRMKETSVTERLETTNVQVIDRAMIPTMPMNINRTRNVLLAMLVGLFLGVSLAFFLEYWNDTITTPEDVKRHLQIPFLGIIPTVSAKSVQSQPQSAKEIMIATITLLDKYSSAAEAYRGLRTYMTFAGLTEAAAAAPTSATFMITSAEPSEGKSSTVANLGIVMAQSGKKTLIIDCDLRKPTIDKIFHLKERAHGIADVLMDAATLNGIGSVIQRTDIENLHIVPCGRIPPNPSELLSFPKIELIFKALQTKYDIILVDSPPVNTVTDAIILGQLVDKVILIFRAGKTKRIAAQRAKEQLVDVGAALLGGVINNVDLAKNRYNSYYYSYHYPGYYHRQEEEMTAGESPVQTGHSGARNLARMN